MTSQWTANPSAYQDRLVNQPGVAVSLETFPPGNELARQGYREAVTRLDQLVPSFISVTSGAGGTGNDATAEAIAQISQLTSTPAAAHLTCINKTRAQIESKVRGHISAGVRHIIALRGDCAEDRQPIAGQTFDCALDLVKAIRRLPEADAIRISVAAYPEGHPDAESVDQEINYLKQKVDAGADQIITQFFFDTEVFLSFHARVRAAGIDVPVIPGILPITNFERAVSFAERCGTRVPKWYHVMYEDLDQNQPLHDAISRSIAVEQCRQLMAFGIRAFHFYTLNQSTLTLSICEELGFIPKQVPDGASAALDQLVGEKLRGAA